MLVVKNVENWAVDHRQRWHSEALQMLGERVVFRHKWNIQDFSLGRCTRCYTCSASKHVNAAQRIRVLSADNGTFRLPLGDEITGEIPYDQTGAGVQAAFEELDSVEPGDVLVTGDFVNDISGVTVEFVNNWGYQNVPLMEADITNLDSSGSVEILQIESGAGGVEQKALVTETYKQSGDSWCPSCYGVGFEGGFEPIIYVTWALISDQQAETTHNPSGVVQRADPQAQFSFEPVVQEFDMIARIHSWEDDGITPKTVGGRFVLHEARPETLRTGPRTADDTPSFAPPQFTSIYSLPPSDLIIGQTTQLEVVPFEHVYHNVPLTPYEETTIEMGIVEGRTWHNRPKSTLNTQPKIRGIE